MNKHNEYSRELGEIFDLCPKTVIAAIAVSMLTCGGDYLNTAKDRFMHEWVILYMNNIVTQKPSNYDYYLNLDIT